MAPNELASRSRALRQRLTTSRRLRRCLVVGAMVGALYRLPAPPVAMAWPNDEQVCRPCSEQQGDLVWGLICPLIQVLVCPWS